MTALPKEALKSVHLVDELLAMLDDGEATTSSTRPATRHVREIVDEKTAKGERFFSFEYFPPKTDKTIATLKTRTLPNMASWGPQWMDVTWGAGGTTSELTPEICAVIENDLRIPCMMHLTCTNMPATKIDIALAEAKRLNIRNILALRGDPPAGEKEWTAIDTGFACALDLVKHIKARYGDFFGITVAGYPEGHPTVRKTIDESAWDAASNTPKYWAPQQEDDGTWTGVSPDDWRTELEYLKSKVDAGAEVIITQLFYDAHIFIEFVRAARDCGIAVPILPGIMPIRNFGLFKRMTNFCRTVVPAKLKKSLTEVQDDTDAIVERGAQWIEELCRTLLEAGVVPGLHVYTMNTELTPALLLSAMGLADGEKLKARIAEIQEKTSSPSE